LILSGDRKQAEHYSKIAQQHRKNHKELVNGFAMNSIEEMRLNSKDLKPVFFEEIYKLVKKNSFIQLKPLMKKEIRK